MTEKRKFNKASIRDVAKRASVSVTTVSHVVSGTKGYSEETVRKVKDAIEALNYVPSYAANALRKRSTKTIGVCARDPFGISGRDVYSYADRLWAGILQEADANGYKVMHFPQSIQESSDASEFLNGQIDCLIMCANNHDVRPMRLAQAGLPVVMLARYFGIPEGVLSVKTDETEIVNLGMRHLAELGHRRIGFVAGPVQVNKNEKEVLDDVALARLQTYQAFIRQLAPEFEPVWITTPDWHPHDLSKELAQWMNQCQPTAIFAANDNHARSILEAAKGMGIDVPGQLSVLGIDNDLLAAHTDPPLTSIDVPVQEIGRAAVKALLQHMKGESLGSLSFSVPAADLVVRSSTGPAPTSTLDQSFWNLQ